MTAALNILKEIDLPEYRITLMSDGIARVLLKTDTVLDLPLQEKLLNSNIEITEGKPTPFLIEAEENVIITKEARDNATLIEDISPMSATAVVVTNIAYALIANFYLKFNKPKTPYKVFNNTNEALKWLKKFK